jgi:hypothetical protein
LLLLFSCVSQIAQLEDRLRAAESAAAAAAATPIAGGGGGAAAVAAAAAADEQLAQLQQQLAASRTQVGAAVVANMSCSACVSAAKLHSAIHVCCAYADGELGGPSGC